MCIRDSACTSHCFFIGNNRYRVICRRNYKTTCNCLAESLIGIIFGTRNNYIIGCLLYTSAAEKSKVIKLQIGSRIVNVDNEAVIYDAAPVIRNDRTLVPIRIVTETLGGKVDWNGATKEVTLHIDGKEIKMTVGKTLEKYGVAPEMCIRDSPHPFPER